MERLTKRVGKYVEIIGCKSLYDSEERKSAPASSAIARLAKYEDTGLEPEEVHALISPPNYPLTLEELREMDGEPVWVAPTRESKNWWVPSTIFWKRPKMDTGWWMLVNAEEEKCFESHWASAYFSEYGKNWVAYRRKPEEGTT